MCCAALYCSLGLLAFSCSALQAQQPIPVLQSGHYSNALALRSDGRLAVTGGYDGLLKWWDRKTGLLIRSVPSHSGPVSTVNFSTNGNLVLSGGIDGVIKVWDTEGRGAPLPFRASTRFIKYATFNRDGEMIASCADGFFDDTTKDESSIIYLWDTRTGRLKQRLQGHAAQVNYLDFDPNGNSLVSASQDKTLKIWSVVTGQLIRTIQTNGENAFVKYSPDGRTIAAVIIKADHKHPEIGFFNAEKGERLGGFSDSESWGGMAISANWQYFAVTSGQKFKIWSIESGKLIESAQSEKYFSHLAISADGLTLVLGGSSSPSFWPFNNPTQPETPSLSFTTGLAVSRDGKLIAWGSGNEVYVWDKSAATLLHVLKGHTEGINEVAFSPDGRTLATSGNDAVKLWSLETGASLGNLAIAKGKDVKNGMQQDWNGSQSVSFSPDGKLLATGENKVTQRGQEFVETLGIRLWDINTRRLIRYFKLPERLPSEIFEAEDPKNTPPYWIRSLAFSPDSRLIASDDATNRILLLSISTGKFRTLRGHEREINSVAFSSDGKRLVSAGFDKTVRVWNVTNGRLVRTMTGHQNRVTSVKFSPNGQIVVSGSLDRTVRFWDAKTGTSLVILEGHDEPVTSIGVSTDNKLVFSTSTDGRVNLWSLDSRVLLGTLVADEDRSWVCFSPEGYYSGNKAERFLAWRLDGQIYPASSYQSQFARPDLLLAKLNQAMVRLDKQPVSTSPPPKQAVLPQPARGGDVRVLNQNGEVRTVELYKRSYALLVGNSDYYYNEAWDDLPGVESDLAEVKRALEKQGFKIVSFDKNGEPLFGHSALNMTRENFRRQVELFVQNYGQDGDNRLLIYYAGHGYTALLPDGRKMGYLVMRDAPRMPSVEDALRRPLSSQQLSAFYPASINMDEIETLAKNITARHALFVFDSCFAGTVLFRDGEVKIPAYLSAEVVEPVREFLTAGNERQRVRDDGIFRRAFVRGIEGAADTTDGDHPKDGFILASELAAYIKKEVIKYSEGQQTPVFGKILKQELARGDFVFAYGEIGPNR
jgi:WD40 repeat protein